MLFDHKLVKRSNKTYDASSKNLKSMIDLFDLARNSHRLLEIVLTVIKIDTKSVFECLTKFHFDF